MTPARGSRGVPALERLAWLGPLSALFMLFGALTCAASGGPVEPEVASSQPFVSEPALGAAPAPGAREPTASGPMAQPAVPEVAVEAPRSALARFFSALHDLRAGRRTTPVRIAWFGDSHTAGQVWPSTVRQALQAGYGSGGPGFVQVGLPGNARAGLRLAHTGRWARQPPAPASRDPFGDGAFGLGGVAVVPEHKSAWAELTLRGLSSDDLVVWRVCHRLQPGASIGVKLGAHRERLAFAAGAAEDGSCTELPPAPAGVGLRLEEAQGDPLVLGVIVERAAPGVVLDALGINGARIATMLAWDETSWVRELGARHPDLVILAYGTNEVFDALDVAHYAEHFRKVLARIRRALPDAECLLLGPPDALDPGGGTRPRVLEMDRLEGWVARELGCGYLSSFLLMGGEGSFSRWIKEEPPLASGDGVHLTPAGYRRLGEAVVGALMAPP